MLANSPAPSFVSVLFTQAGRAVVSAFYGVHSLIGIHISGALAICNVYEFRVKQLQVSVSEIHAQANQNVRSAIGSVMSQIRLRSSR